VTPLSWYRRTGADPPFGDQRRAHGTRFEGYYWRLTDAAGGRVAIVLCGVCRDAAGPWAIVAMATEPGGLVRSRIEPLALQSPRLHAGRSISAGSDHLRVDLGPDARLDLRFEERVGWPRRAFGGTGPAQIVPGLPQYWHPHVLGGVVRGSGWDGAVVYAEKNWGPRFTEHWWWGQAQAFEGADACVAFAGGRVLGGAPTGVVARVEDRVLRLSPPFAQLRTAVGDASWRVRARSPRWEVVIEAEGVGEPAVLPVPVPGRREVEPRSQQYLTGRLRATVRRGGRIWWSGESSLAGLERWL
jgi:tocopherol cyclase